MEMYNAYGQYGLSRGRVDRCDAGHRVHLSTLRIRTQCTAASHLYHDLQLPAKQMQSFFVSLT